MKEKGCGEVEEEMSMTEADEGMGGVKRSEGAGWVWMKADKLLKGGDEVVKDEM